MRRVLLMAVLLALPLGACGDDDGSAPSTTSTTLSQKAAYIRDADALCGHLSDDIKSLHAPKSVEDTIVYIQERIVLGTRAREALAELHPPADASEVHQALLDELEQSAAKAGEALEAARRNDIASLGTLLDEARTLGHAANDLADAYGFKDCGSA